MVCVQVDEECSVGASVLMSLYTSILMLGARTLLVAPGITTSNNKLLVTRALLLGASSYYYY